MLSKYSLPIVCLMLLSQSFILAATRQWTSSDGRFKIEADLVAYDGQVAELKKVDGTIIKVPVSKLSAADREFLKPFKGLAARAAPAQVAKLPASVMKFQKAMDAMREIEAKRLEGRIAELKQELRFGANDSRHPIAQEARLLTRTLIQRMELVKSGKPFIPQLSPMDFEVGQIGEFDDDLLFDSEPVQVDGTVPVAVLFDSIRYRERISKSPLGWHHLMLSRPDRFLLRADFVTKLSPMVKDFEHTSPTNRLLRMHAYEIVANHPSGAMAQYVLAQFNMDEVSVWLKDQSKLPSR
ncbi:MAG: SHD1 domain-containing protein [Aureliella sp.]